MMKLLTLSLAYLKNEEHFQFMTGIKELLTDENLENLQLDGLFPLFREALDKECKVIELVRKLAVNDTMGQHNGIRTNCYKSLVLAVRQYLVGDVYTEKRTAAQKINAFIVHYKKLPVRGATERIASYSNFLKDLREQCTDEIALLELNKWLTPLETANKTVESLWYQRAEIQGANRRQLRMVSARQSIDTVYRRMMGQLNVLLLLDAQEHETIVQKLNSHLQAFKTALARRKTLRKTTVEPQEPELVVDDAQSIVS